MTILPPPTPADHGVVARFIEEVVNLIVLKYRFFASLILMPQHMIDDTIETANTDGHIIRYNSGFVFSLNLRQRIGLVLHELGHIFLGHFWRKGWRDHDRWQVAADLEVNHLLQQFGITLPPDALVDDRFRGWAAEAIYPHIPPQPKKQGWAGDDIREPAPDMTNANAPKPQMWARQVQKAVTLAQKFGKLPSDLERLVQSTKEVIPDWRNITQQFLTEAARNDWTYSRRNRRYEDIVMPTLYSKEIPCVGLIKDTSGSIDTDIHDLFSANCLSILDEVRPKLVVVISADAKVQTVREFTPMDPIVWDDKGGGGTDFRPAIKYLAEHYQPVAVVYLTDLEGTFPDQEPDFPVLWATNNARLIEHVPFGVGILLTP